MTIHEKIQTLTWPAICLCQQSRAAIASIMPLRLDAQFLDDCSMDHEGVTKYSFSEWLTCTARDMLGCREVKDVTAAASTPVFLLSAELVHSQ